MNNGKYFFSRDSTPQYSEILLDNIFVWYFHDICYTDPAWLSLTNERKFVD